MEVHKDVRMDKVIVAVRKICFHNIKDGEYNMSSENNVLSHKAKFHFYSMTVLHVWQVEGDE